jgi:TPR repeat protein
MALKQWIAITLLTGLCLGCATKSTLREGIENFKAQDYRQAFVRLKPQAEKGQPDAQYAVGYMYYYGQGVVEDRQQAWYWINQAATAGQPDAIEAAGILSKNNRH